MEIMPLFNLEAERAVIGTILMDEKGTHMDVAVGMGLATDDFSTTAFREVFRTCLDLRENNRPTDPLTVQNELASRGTLQSIGGIAFLSDLIDGAVERGSIKAPVKIVIEKSAKRKTAAACETARSSLDAGDTSKQVISNLGDRLLEIQSGVDSTEMRPICAYVDSILNEWLKLAESGEELIGLSTGVRSIDLDTTGLRPGELWVYGGRTSDGKSSLALQAAAANVIRNVPVGIFSYELTRREILHRLWVAESGLPYLSVRNPRMLGEERRKEFVRAACESGSWPLYVVEDSSLNISQLVARARLLIRQHGIRLVIVDFVQNVSAPGANERERLSRVSNSLRILAKDTQVPVIAVSQLARPDRKNENERPTKYHLKESGSLENDAHVVLLIYRPYEGKERSHEDELIIAKQRNGMTGSEDVYFDARTLTFRERETVRPERALRCEI
jgi:replicative DNA helicase